MPYRAELCTESILSTSKGNLLDLIPRMPGVTRESETHSPEQEAEGRLWDECATRDFSLGFLVLAMGSLFRILGKELNSPEES